MSRATIDEARSLIRKKKYSNAIVLLEGVRELYRNSFDYYLVLGIACLYSRDYGNSYRNFDEARHIKVQNVDLLLGQAALYLVRGDTSTAIGYYLDILDLEPENKKAKAALEFVRSKGDYETIVKWTDTGKIEEFYPEVAEKKGVWPLVFSIFAGGFAALAILFCMNLSKARQNAQRADLSELDLTASDKSGLQEKDLSGGVYKYILSDSQITQAYEKAKFYFQNYRDNSSRVEINRILNSNASQTIKSKSELLILYFEEPSFDSFSSRPEENFTYSTVAAEPALYADCWVVWSGRISNAKTENGVFSCDLLVGYENLERVDGIVPVIFDVVPKIEGDRAVKILAQIKLKDGKLCLFGRSVYQPLRKN